MNKKYSRSENFIRNNLGFDSSFPYFGPLASQDLSNSYHKISKGYIPECKIWVGNLNNKIIADALNKELSYNPLRWKGIKFTTPSGALGLIYDDINQFSALATIKEKIKSYNLSYYKIITKQGNVIIDIKMQSYYPLRRLFEILKIIKYQNLSDFGLKKQPYRKEMIQFFYEHYPKNVNLEELGFEYSVKPGQQVNMFENPYLIAIKKRNTR